MGAGQNGKLEIGRPVRGIPNTSLHRGSHARCFCGSRPHGRTLQKAATHFTEQWVGGAFDAQSEPLTEARNVWELAFARLEASPSTQCASQSKYQSRRLGAVCGCTSLEQVRRQARKVYREWLVRPHHAERRRGGIAERIEISVAVLRALDERGVEQHFGPDVGDGPGRTSRDTGAAQEAQRLVIQLDERRRLVKDGVGCVMEREACAELRLQRARARDAQHCRKVGQHCAEHEAWVARTLERQRGVAEVVHEVVVAHADRARVPDSGGAPLESVWNRSMDERRTWTAELTGERALGPSVRHLVLQVREPREFRWLPGQYVELFERSVPGRRFAYSVASAPLETVPGRFELAVGRDGSAYAVDALRVGDIIEVTEPRGSFIRPLGSSLPAVFIGVGTGAAPLRAMIQAALLHESPAPLTLLFGCRSEEELLWGQEFARWAEDSRFSFQPTLSRPSATWTGRRGYVQAHLESLGAALESAEFYVCGSRSMTTDVAERLGSLGVAHERIQLEGY